MRIVDNPRLPARLLAAYFAALALIGFWPTPVDAPAQSLLTKVLAKLHAHGIPGWINYNLVEASANVLLFIPVGFAAALALPSRRWWHISALGLLASACVELGQFLFLPHRVASLLDVATNTAGAVVGVILARALRERNKRRALLTPTQNGTSSAI
ncbi:VanZ family protein [Arthrobacter sp. PsM3]|uniref:VanZ family protein n=1 Tax=Arthrobacter sp. PsM3 TaxID=3030531 RepID=UPI00263BC8D8|nr:VanZ family protein [Arthrobacter sp. PsM3]MDN4645133.1 VanZ family protein [Arthrobacter sp. PsM3]